MKELLIYLSENKVAIYKKNDEILQLLRIHGEEKVEIRDIKTILELKEYFVNTYLDSAEERCDLKIKIFYDYTISKTIIGNFLTIFSQKISIDTYREKPIQHRIEAINIDNFNENCQILEKKFGVKYISPVKEKVEEKEECNEKEQKICTLEEEIKKLKKENRKLRIEMVNLEKNFKLQLLKKS